MTALQWRHLSITHYIVCVCTSVRNTIIYACPSTEWNPLFNGKKLMDFKSTKHFIMDLWKFFIFGFKQINNELFPKHFSICNEPFCTRRTFFFAPKHRQNPLWSFNEKPHIICVAQYHYKFFLSFWWFIFNFNFFSLSFLSIYELESTFCCSLIFLYCKKSWDVECWMYRMPLMF